MQKSKKMMVSLCGLALSSLFVLNNKSVVHADTVTGAQNNAISWDSDSDDSQVVQESQTKIEQVMPQKADNSQQKATQPVQSRAEPNKVESSSVQSSTIVKNKAETSAASSSLIQNNNSINAKVNRAVLVSRVDSENYQTNAVRIVNPKNNKVKVHYVDMNGNSVDIPSTTIDTTHSGHGTYSVPNGYKLQNNNYQVVRGKVDPSSITTWQFRSSDTGKYDNNSSNSESFTVSSSVINTLNNFLRTKGTQVEPGDFITLYIEEGEWHIGDADYAKHSQDSGWYSKGYGLHGLFTFNGTDDHLPPMDGTYGTLPKANPDIRKLGNVYTTVKRLAKKYNVEEDNLWCRLVIGDANKRLNTFVDKSGQVKAVNGNTIDLAVTKPQNVDPASDARMRATATRTIQINFPGSIPPSYKNIVNDEGVLTQTVTFMRTGQEDALTGDLIDSTLTPWKSNNQDPNFLGFPERTLPRIPGYTLSIKPA